MGRDDYSQSSQLSTLVGKPVSRYTELPKNTDTLRKLTDAKLKPNNRYHYSIYPEIETEYQASYSQLTNLDFYSPIITILGDNPYAHLINTPFTDPGIILDEGSTLVSNVSTVNTNAFGTFKITYVATDGINPDTTRVRTVKVGEFPDVTIDGDNPYILERYDQYIDDGVTINDANSTVRSTTSTVNNTVVGNYTVNYTVANEVFTRIYSRSVKVVDTSPPVVTVLGDNPYTLERFDVYTDPGATGDLGTTVTTDLSNVQNTSIGSFVVVYNATDGNTAHDVAVTRTVNVVDTNAPVITILGDNPYTLERFDVYTDRGATVDRGSILTTDLTAVNNTLPHGASFVVTYSATDGNTAHDVTVTRTVNIEDTKPPQLTILGADPYPMQPYGYFPDLDPGFEVDLGTSVSINYAAINANNVEAGFQTVVYTASDGVHPDVVKTRVVAVADTVSPIITITGDNPYTLERYAEYVDDGATVDEGSTLETANTVSTVDNTAVGSYTVTYSATDSINPDTIAVRIVNVVDTKAPIVTLNGASSVTLERYGVFADIDEGVDMDANGILVSVDTSQLDNTTQGTYTVTYNVVDDQENANVITREVVVADTTPPVVTLNNESTFYTLERYGVWADIDPGVTVDEGSYVYQINVNNTATGIQSVEYIVRDGTNETTVYRTIRVSDTVAPVITVNEPNYVHEIYTQYTDPGATVDNGSILTTDTSNADVSNTANIGTFEVVYSATDGNTAHDVTVIRTVTVVDTVPPVGSLINDSYTTERFGAYSDPGVNLDTGSFVAGIDLSNVNTSLPHGSTFDVVYDLSDSNVSHNVYLTRTVTVVDTTDPVITLNGASVITLERYTPFVHSDLDVILDEGSYLTNVDTSLLNNAVVGTYIITYEASDDVNTSTLNRFVSVIDSTPPVITIEGDNPYYVERFSEFVDPYASADPGSTLYPADLSNVNMDGLHNSTFDVVYKAYDGNNTTYAVRSVVVVDTVPPVITITDGDYSIERFSTYSESGVTVDEGSTYFGSDTSNVDESLVYGNTFDVVYTAFDGNNFSKAIRTITIDDTVPPVITIAGDNPKQIYYGNVYQDPGASVSTDGFLTTDLSNVSNTLINSTFDVVYNATDGNTAHDVSATRTVVCNVYSTFRETDPVYYSFLRSLNAKISADGTKMVTAFGGFKPGFDLYEVDDTGITSNISIRESAFRSNGGSVAISGNNTRIAFGDLRYINVQDEIHIYKLNTNGTWTSEATLTHTDNSRFGFDLSMSNDGSRLLAASRGTGTIQTSYANTGNHGSLKIYKRVNSTWSLITTLIPNTGGYYFTYEVPIRACALSGDGNYAVATWTASSSDDGYDLASIFTGGTSSWSQQFIYAPNSSIGNSQVFIDYYGTKVSIGGRIYTRSGSTWTYRQTIYGTHKMSGDGNKLIVHGYGSNKLDIYLYNNSTNQFYADLANTVTFTTTLVSDSNPDMSDNGRRIIIKDYDDYINYVIDNTLN